MNESATETLDRVVSVYDGSDGQATKALYEELAKLGPIGTVSINLFRAQKSSARAKVYRGGARGRGSFRGMAYDRKQWALDNLVRTLTESAEACCLQWGWGEDEAQSFHRFVLYVDLPSGQVSFHTEARGTGPDYPAAWDGIPGQSPARICRFVASVLGGGVG